MKRPMLKLHFGATYKNKWKRQRNIHEAVEYLKNYDAAENPTDWDGWEAHIDRWNVEAAGAYEWLENYQNEHFN